MNTATTSSSRIALPDADRVGVAASVLCAIHCGLAPILLLALPTFGKIWAHPASHALVAIFIIPLAIFSIRKGYQRHRRHWVAIVAATGILCVLVGAALPAFTEKTPLPSAPPESSAIAATDSEACEADSEVCSESECSETCEATAEACSEEECTETCSEEGCTLAAESGSGDSGTAETVGCIDNCCPSAQISESGEISIHVPPAAIVTTLGGIFLITAHIGNIMGCRSCACCSSKVAQQTA